MTRMMTFLEILALLLLHIHFPIRVPTHPPLARSGLTTSRRGGGAASANGPGSAPRLGPGCGRAPGIERSGGRRGGPKEDSQGKRERLMGRGRWGETISL